MREAGKPEAGSLNFFPCKVLARKQELIKHRSNNVISSARKTFGRCCAMIVKSLFQNWIVAPCYSFFCSKTFLFSLDSLLTSYLRLQMEIHLGLHRWAWSIIAGAHRNCNPRKQATGDWTKYISRYRSYTILSNFRDASWCQMISFSGVYHARGT